MRALRKGQDVAEPHEIVGLVHELAVDADLAGGAQLGGERAALAEAGEPQPFVEPPAVLLVHLPNLRSARRANGVSPGATLAGRRRRRRRGGVLPLATAGISTWPPRRRSAKVAWPSLGLATEPQGLQDRRQLLGRAADQSGQRVGRREGALPRQQVGRLRQPLERVDAHGAAADRAIAEREIGGLRKSRLAGRGSAPAQESTGSGRSLWAAHSTRLSMTTRGACRGPAARCSRGRDGRRDAPARRDPPGFNPAELRARPRRAAGRRDWRPAGRRGRGRGRRDRLRALATAAAGAGAGCARAIAPGGGAGARARAPSSSSPDTSSSRGVSG